MLPTSFENLVYDLASSAGLRNAVWRTPGSDEGRDIEGEITTIDFSGYYATTKWYIECKRYSTSVDWPTVWQKIAYADSHSADYLFIVTTAHLSPQCKTEISRWHGDRRRPAIRVWDAANLEQILLQHPRVLIKYAAIPGRQSHPVLILISPLAFRQHACDKTPRTGTIGWSHEGVCHVACCSQTTPTSLRRCALPLGSPELCQPPGSPL